MDAMKNYIGAVDQGTTSTRFAVLDQAGRTVAWAQKEHAQHTPRPGWVEHDAEEICRTMRETAAEALARAGIGADRLRALGITNQRETSLLWDRRSGRPLHRALVWQDTRVDTLVAAYAAAGGKSRFAAQTGLPLASYFSALKLQWLLDHVDGARDMAEAGDALFGTMDSFLIWQLSGVHVTDVTNASRTQLMDLATLAWCPSLLEAFRIPRACLPRIVASSGFVAEVAADRIPELAGVPIAGVLGDQQAALVGQVCLAPGEAKNTYGTGNFLLMNTGTSPVASKNGLITTVAYKLGDAPACYALEGSIAITGALIQWLRDNLGLVSCAEELDALAARVDDTGGVYIVPAFSGLYAPYWREEARGVICGLTRFARKEHICRAALEAAAYQTADVVRAMEEDSGVALRELRVDGGMVRSAPLMQFQADILDTPVVRPSITETTALGAAYAAGLATGFWAGTDTLRAQWQKERSWHPAMNAARRNDLLDGWKHAVQRALL
jgi:glycerol kinase